MNLPLLPRLSAAGLAVFALTLHAGKVTAGDTVVEFDPAQTQVQFTLGDIFHTVKGTFKLKRGTIRYDPVTGAASGALVIDTASGNSGNGARDGKMKQQILETQKYPEITFTPHHVKGHVAPDGDSKVEVEGTFNLHGADHPLTLLVQVSAKNSQLTAVTRFVVPYVQWGLKNPSTFILRVSEKVDIEIRATGHVGPKVVTSAPLKPASPESWHSSS
jgi:polyisoprenoid-binding protein YceI